VLGEDKGRKHLAESAFKMADDLHEYANEKDVQYCAKIIGTS
jgi:hypothetical protein